MTKTRILSVGLFVSITALVFAFQNCGHSVSSSRIVASQAASSSGATEPAGSSKVKCADVESYVSHWSDVQQEAVGSCGSPIVNSSGQVFGCARDHAVYHIFKFGKQEQRCEGDLPPLPLCTDMRAYAALWFDLAATAFAECGAILKSFDAAAESCSYAFYFSHIQKYGLSEVRCAGDLPKLPTCDQKSEYLHSWIDVYEEVKSKCETFDISDQCVAGVVQEHIDTVGKSEHRCL